VCALQPPFNVAARDEAGFTSAWYEPLATLPRAKGAKIGSQAAEGAEGGSRAADAAAPTAVAL